MRFARIASLGLLSLAAAASLATARFPEPSPYPVSWELKFESQPLRRIVVETPGSNVPKTYWYMLYTVTNNTGQEQTFLPQFEMLTKTGKVLLSDRLLSPAVFDAIARRHRQYAMPAGTKINGVEVTTQIEPALKIAGQILQGEDQARVGVAIWEEPDAEMGSISVFVAGLSGEMQSLKGDDGKPVTNAEGKTTLLRKTLQLDYTIRGDELKGGNDQIVETGKRWIMR
jgi:hypothetical protein